MPSFGSARLFVAEMPRFRYDVRRRPARAVIRPSSPDALPVRSRNTVTARR